MRNEKVNIIYVMPSMSSMSYLEPYLLHEYIIAGLVGKEVALGRQHGQNH